MFAGTTDFYILYLDRYQGQPLTIRIYIDWVNIHSMSYFNLSVVIIKYKLFSCTDKYWLIIISIDWYFGLIFYW